MQIFPTAIFKDETRMNSRARKVQQNGHKCHAAIPSLEQWRQCRLNSINFFHINCCRTNNVTLSVIIITSHCLSIHRQTSQSSTPILVLHESLSFSCSSEWIRIGD